MPIRNILVFQKSLLAIAVISLSACSTTPRVPDYDLSQVGAGILQAGRTTAEFSRRTWEKTTYLLGFSDANEPSGDEQLMDDVDLALLEPDAQAMPVEGMALPKVEEQATAYPLDRLRETRNIEVEELPAGRISENLSNEGLIVEDSAREDLIHEVVAAENLWKIAKNTTGDATNWHVLADVNNLAPDAAVFPGQELIIPADMVKAGYFDAVEAESETEQAALEELQAEPQTLETAALNVPASSTTNEITNVDSQRLRIPTEGDQQSSSDETQLNSDSELTAGTAFKLQPAETLWDLAKRTTGDALNWKAIAEQNNFTERQSVVVHAGQTIYVPQHLVRSPESRESAKNEILKTSPATEPTAVASLATPATVPELPQAELPQVDTVAVAKPTMPSTIEKIQPTAPAALAMNQHSHNATEHASENLIVKAPALTAPKIAPELNANLGNSATSLLDETQTITLSDASASSNNALMNGNIEVEQAQSKIVETNYNTIEPAQPLAQTADTMQSKPLNNLAAAPAEIMVSGTYYPKAVYNQADFSSSLLMRVSPGTKLQVSNAMGTWFQVETDKGIGYVHQRDIK